jgi:DNA-directed RNA polymerase subunit alpha
VVLESKGLRLGLALEEEEAASGTAAGEPEAESEDKSLLSKPVEDLNLSVRARKCLQKLSIRTLDDLVQKTDAELLGCKNFGVTSLNEITKALGNIGLSLRTLD